MDDIFIVLIITKFPDAQHFFSFLFGTSTSSSLTYDIFWQFYCLTKYFQQISPISYLKASYIGLAFLKILSFWRQQRASKFLLVVLFLNFYIDFVVHYFLTNWCYLSGILASSIHAFYSIKSYFVIKTHLAKKLMEDKMGYIHLSRACCSIMKRVAYGDGLAIICTKIFWNW